MFVLLIGCNKEDSKPKSTPNKEFALSDINGKQIKSIEPSLLKAVHENLLKSGRNDDAAKLFNQYDTITGSLKGMPAVFYPKQDGIIDSSLISENADTITNAGNSNLKSANFWEYNGVLGYGHVQGIGDQSGVRQNDADILTSNFIGTVAQSKRLESIMINLTTYPSERPILYYSLKNERGQWLTASWGGWAGIKGQGLTNYYVQMWFDKPFYHIFYKTHHSSKGWLANWYSNTQVCGYGSRMEALAFYILYY